MQAILEQTIDLEVKDKETPKGVTPADPAHEALYALRAAVVVLSPHRRAHV